MHLNHYPHLPYLQTIKDSKQLIVDKKPFLILGAEVHNSSFSSAEYMRPVLSALADDNVNTVLGSVSWEQIEEKEGQFDFSQLDLVVTNARLHGLRLVLLWFGSWKNGLSTYVPGWVKRDNERFPRAKLRKDGRLETADILSLFESDVMHAEKRAFVALMQHVKKIDESHSTILMIQVENEVGILGDSRDASSQANKTFEAAVPQSLILTLKNEWGSLHSRLVQNLEIFQKADVQGKGASWVDVFGESAKTEEIFMAYYYALHVQQIAAAGKEVYPLPMFTNVWQNYGADDRDLTLPAIAAGGSNPGVYPSGGAVIDVLDIWQLFAPSLDFVAPDIYLNLYSSSCSRYRHRSQPLFIPEQRRDEYGARRIWEAFGSYFALGACPFGIDTVRAEHGCNPFAKHYGLLSQVSQLVLAAQRVPGSMIGFFFDDFDPKNQDTKSEQVYAVFGQWQLSIQRSFVFGTPSSGSGLVIQLAESRFLLVGWGFQVSFRSTKSTATFSGILSMKEKRVTDTATGEMETLRLLNGDETRSGKCAVMPSGCPDYGGFPISITIPARTGIAEVEVYILE